MTEKIDQFLDRRFYWVVAVICVIYAVIEITYVTGLLLVMDEFQGAYAVTRLSDGIPYRDFMPYKTILGYYIQLPALMLPGDTWSKLMYVKTEMTVINTVAIFFAFLAGGVILNVLKEELPAEGKSRYWAFLVGLTGYSALLVAL